MYACMHACMYVSIGFKRYASITMWEYYIYMTMTNHSHQLVVGPQAICIQGRSITTSHGSHGWGPDMTYSEVTRFLSKLSHKPRVQPAIAMVISLW